MNHDINICTACDENYAKYAGVMIASVLLSANNEDEFTFYILDCGISNKTKVRINRLKLLRYCDIHFIPVNEELFKAYKNISQNKNSSIITYYKLGLSKLLPRVNRILYFDCDIIVKKSLKELFFINLEEKYIAGVLDIKAKFKSEFKNMNYINTGMLLMDLERIRKDNIENDFIKYAANNSHNIVNGVSDIINFALPKKIKVINDTWNVQVVNFFKRSNYTNKPSVIHYTGAQKPWIFASYNHFKQEYLNILSQTPWEIPQEELYKWGRWNNICAFIHFTFGKSLFFLKLKFWDKISKPVPDKDIEEQD